MTSSTLQILIGLGLGIAAGLFLGERATVFQFAADGLVRLRQMTVLPYVVVSLIVGIGSLDARRARLLFLQIGENQAGRSYATSSIGWTERVEEMGVIVLVEENNG